MDEKSIQIVVRDVVLVHQYNGTDPFYRVSVTATVGKETHLGAVWLEKDGCPMGHGIRDWMSLLIHRLVGHDQALIEELRTVAHAAIKEKISI